MPLHYLTKAGETADFIVWKLYGDRSGAVEALLDANPGLADEGCTLPAGLTVIVPEPSAETPRTTIRIWG